VNVFMVVDPAPPAFIPCRAISSRQFFFTFIRPGGNKIEAGQVIQNKGK